jgi:hypothetical protein
MKKLISFVGFFSLSLLLLSTTNSDNASFDARINTYKQELKEMIKPSRYEGSRVTYYAQSKEIQHKNIESFFLIDTEYKLAFSGKECSSDVNLKIYDSNDPSKRTLLKEVKNLKGKNTVVSSTELSKTFQKKVNQSERLKVVYIDYEIASGNSKLEAIVLVVGYKD